MPGSKYEKEKYEFAVFCTMTKIERMEHYGFEKDKDFAAHYGIPFAKTLSEWKRTPTFKKIHRELLLDRMGKRLPDAINSFERRAIEDGDVTALKELFKIVELSKDKLEIVSSDDIKILLEQIVEILQEELKDTPELLNRIAERIEKLDM